MVFQRRESDQKCPDASASKNCSERGLKPGKSKNKAENVKFANLHWNNLKTPKSVQKCPHECKSKICSKKYSILQKNISVQKIRLKKLHWMVFERWESDKNSAREIKSKKCSKSCSIAKYQNICTKKFLSPTYIE